MEKIKILKQVRNLDGGYFKKDDIVNVGKERNTNAVKAGLAVWVDSRSLKDEKPLSELNPTEKKEGTPKKTTTSVKGKKIETK